MPLHARITTCTHRVLLGLVLATLGLLGACGGGGGGNASPLQTLVGLPRTAAQTGDINVTTFTVKRGPGGNVNIPYVSVTLCEPGSSTNCKTIDDVLLDTGSTGLRIFSDVLAAKGLTLPPYILASGSVVAECAYFMQSVVAWGPVKLADVTLGKQKTVTPIPVHSMEATSGSSNCGNFNVMAPPLSNGINYPSGSNLSELSANGILGISQFIHDGQTYFNCTGTNITSCQLISALPPSQQVSNPVSSFQRYNNGVILQMKSVPSLGATAIDGFLIFGVETGDSNNRLDDANIVPVNSQGRFTTTYKTRTLSDSFFDSGSNGLYFDDPDISRNCNIVAFGFYCPPGAFPLSADIQLTSGTAKIDFSVANADQLIQSGNYVYSNIGGSLNNNMYDYAGRLFSNTFDWGLPFFFGRSVYTVIEGKTAGGRTGPFYAFTAVSN